MLALLHGAEPILCCGRKRGLPPRSSALYNSTMPPGNPKTTGIESLLGDPQNLPEIARLMGQFESEEAYRRFKAEWEAVKPPANASARLPQPDRRFYRRSFLGRIVSRLQRRAAGAP